MLWSFYEVLLLVIFSLTISNFFFFQIFLSFLFYFVSAFVVLNIFNKLNEKILVSTKYLIQVVKKEQKNVNREILHLGYFINLKET